MDAQILKRVVIGKQTAKCLLAATHTIGYSKSPRRKLDSQERALNKHNAKAERDYCAQLLRAGRHGLSVIQAHWVAIGSRTLADLVSWNAEGRAA